MSQNTNFVAAGAYHKKLLRYRKENLAFAMRNPNEEWMWQKLLKTGHIWERQGLWGYRMFDFWCRHMGVAVEVDGPEHDTERDANRDAQALLYGGIVVLRVKNRDEEGAERVLRAVAAQPDNWDDRKRQIWIRQSGTIHKGQFRVRPLGDRRIVPRPIMVGMTGQDVTVEETSTEIPF